MEIVDQEAAIDLYNKAGDLICQGRMENGQRVLVMGKAAAYPMKGGKTSSILIVGLPMNYLKDVLFLNEKDSAAYSHIIDDDGSFVVRSEGAFRENYVSWVREH